MKQSYSNTHRQSGSTAYRLQARPTGPGLLLTAMPHPNLLFNGLHLRNPYKLHGSLLIYRPIADALPMVTRQLWTRRRSGKVSQLQTDVLTIEPRCSWMRETTVLRNQMSTSPYLNTPSHREREKSSVHNLTFYVKFPRQQSGF